MRSGGLASYNSSMRKSSRALRAVAAFLAFALVHASFGTQSWAQVANIGSMSAPVNGSAASAAVTAAVPSISINSSLAPSVLGLNGSLSAPAFTPSPLASAIPAAASLAVASALAPTASAPSAVSARPISVPLALTPAAVSAAAAKNDESKPSLTPAAKTALPSAEAPVVTGALTSRAAAKASAIVAGVRRYFTGKSVESVESAPSPLVAGKLSAPHASDLEPSNSGDAARPQSNGGANEPPAPKQPNDPAPKGKGWFGLGAIVAALIGGMLVMQLGLEAQGAAMAQLTENAFGDFSILAQVAIFASIGSMVGQQLAQFVSSRIGLTKTFYAAHTLRAISLGTMVFLLGTGHMALPLMFVFYAVNGVVTGIAGTAEGTLRKFLLAKEGVSQQKFRTWWQFLAEVFGVLAPMVLGALVTTIGASWITALYPATIILGLMLFLMLKVLPLSSAAAVENQVGGPAATPAAPVDPNAPKVDAWQKVKNAFAQIFNNMEEGKEFVFKNAVLKYSLGGAVIFDLMNVLIYRLITPGYGKLIAGSSGMAAVQGNLVGMFSLGGLILAATFLVLERRDKKKNESKTPEELVASERSSMLRWTMLGIPALGLLAVMAFHLTLPFAPLIFAGVNWAPSTAFGAALIPFGFMQVAASIKLNSYFQERLPADAAKVQKAIAFSGSAMTALSIVLMLALKPLFGDIAAFNPFPYIAAALIPLGAAIFFIQRKLAAATKPENLKIAGDLGKPAGGFVGVLLGVIAAALLLSFISFIPGMAGVLAGLGVLGRFALHLSVALAIPAAGWFADRAIRKKAAKK